jgi:prepilin-type N-terminal cleavage/methylation domain-containing protein
MNKGFSLIEVMVSVAIVAILCVSFTTLTLQALKVARINASELKARMYLQEEMEAVIDLEQSDWSKLSDCSTTCHAEISGNKWVLSGGPDSSIEGYTRYLTIGDIGDGTDKKEVTAVINWSDNKELQIKSYVYNYE